MRNDASRPTTGANSIAHVRSYHWTAFLLTILTLAALAPERSQAEALLLPHATLAPEEPEPEEGFGRALAIDGDVAVVTANIGSFFGAGPDDPGGAAYVFERNTSGEWHQTAKLQPATAGGLFGHSVAVEGRTVVVGAPFSSAAYVYEDLGSGWVLTQTLSSGGGLGFSVAIDDGVVAVSSNTPHGIKFFRKGTGGWTLIATLPGGGNAGGSDYRGPRVDIGGNRAIHHSPGDNFTEPEQPQLVYIHTRPSGGDWNAASTVIVGGNIDRQVTISGNVAVIGGVIYELDGNGWHAVEDRVASDVEADVDGDLVARASSINQRDAAGEWPLVASLLDPQGQQVRRSRLSGRRTISLGYNHPGAFVHDIPLNLDRASLTQDDFQDGNAAGWTTLGGTFSVVANTHTSVYRQTSLTGNAAAFLGGAYGADQSIQADIRPTAFDGLDRWFGLIARYADANNYYYVTARTSNVVQLKKIVGGVVQTLGSVPLAVQANWNYRLRLETVGEQVRVLIDDRLVLDVRDTSLLQGQAGLMMYKAAANYDNVVWNGNPAALLFNSTFEISSTPVADLMYPQPHPQGWEYPTVGGSRLLAYTRTDGGSQLYNFANGVNQVVSIDARATQFNGADRWFGVALRYQDSQNYYYLTMRNSNTVSLRKLVNGVIHTLDTASFTVASNTWYRLRLENVGSSLRGYIDGQLVVEANDATLTPQSPPGGAAVVLYKTATQYDNFRVVQP